MRTKLFLKTFIILLFIVGVLTVKAQDRHDAIFAKYLIEKGEIDSLIFNKKKHGNKVDIETNFYSKKAYTSAFEKGTVFIYKFGSYTEHVKPHLALVYEVDKANIQFFDCLKIEEDLKKLFVFLEGVVSSKENDKKVTLIKEFVKLY